MEFVYLFRRIYSFRALWIADAFDAGKYEVEVH